MPSKSLETKGFSQRIWCLNRLLWRTNPGFYAVWAVLIGDGVVFNILISGLPNVNAKSQRFSYAISQIASLPPVVALNRSSKSQVAARYAAFWHAIPQIALASFL